MFHRQIQVNKTFKSVLIFVGEFYRLCQEKLYNFQFFIVEKVKHSNNTPVAKSIFFLCVRRFLNGIIPWISVIVMVLWVMSGKNKVSHFRHYYESFGSSPIGETHSDLKIN